MFTFNASITPVAVALIGAFGLMAAALINGIAQAITQVLVEFIKYYLGKKSDGRKRPDLPTRKRVSRRRVIVGSVIGVLSLSVLFTSVWMFRTEPMKGMAAGGSGPFSVGAHYSPSGSFGDTGDVTIARLPGLDHFEYETKGLKPEWEWKYINHQRNPIPAQFAGVMYLDPPNNWGRQAGGFDLRSYKKAHWEARAWERENPSGTVNVEFVMGGINWGWDESKMEIVTPPYPETLPRKSLGIKSLQADWQPFEESLIGLQKSDLRRVIGGFAWDISWGANGVVLNDAQRGPKNPKTFILELRDIQFEQ